MDWPRYASTLIGSVLGGVAVLWIVAGYYHVRYYQKRKHEPESWKCQPKRFLRAEQQRRAMQLSTMNLAIGGVISGNLVYFSMSGWEGTKVYTDVSEYGWAWTIGGTLVFFVMADALAYYAHRFMHGRFMFKNVHRHHHKFVATSPWVVTAMPVLAELNS